MDRRLLPWVVRRVGPRGLLTLCLLFTALASVSLGLASVIRGLDSRLLLFLSTAALLSGWFLARRGLPGWCAVLSLALLGPSLAVLVLGRLDRVLVERLGAWREPLAPPSVRPVWDALLVLARRGAGWVEGIAAGQPGYDPVAAALAWSLLLWAVSSWAGWSIRRLERPLVTLLPPAGLLLVTLFYSGGDLYYLLPLLGSSSFLLVLVGHVIRERSWEARGIDYSLDIRSEIVIAAISLTLLVTFVAAATPSLSLASFARAMRSLTGESMAVVRPVADSFGLRQRMPRVSPFDDLRAPGLPRSHLVGAGPELGEQHVMTISVESDSTSPLPRRWRGLTYDRYSGRGWSTSRSESVDYEAGEAIHPVMGDVALVVEYSVQAERIGGGPVYAPGALASVDQPYSVAWRDAGDFFGAYTMEREYRVESLVPVASQASLRGAGARYPRWLARRYLALPDSVPERVLALARELTATEPTPYDRALAIERYLRAFPYTLDIPAPPPGRELTDYFLFELRKGYCDYFATAMVVLARAAGIPARIAVGYASGQYDPGRGSYLVTEAEAHSWAELYFPGHGWIAFEPTPAREPISPLEEATEGNTVEVQDRLGKFAMLLQSVAWPVVAGGCLLVLGFLLVGRAVKEEIGLRRKAAPQAIEEIYRRLYRQGGRLGAGSREGETPYEFSADLAARLVAVTRALEKRVPTLRPFMEGSEEHVVALARLYVDSIYGSQCPKGAQSEEAFRRWRSLRWRLWLARVSWRLTRLDRVEAEKGRGGATVPGDPATIP